MLQRARSRFDPLFADHGYLFFSLAAIFSVVLGSRLWLISCFGSDVPFWDQWNSEGAMLYKPFLERGVTAVDWFGSHNEHRITLSRVTSVLLLILNMQWDPIVQMCWEAFCAAFTATMLCAMIARLLSVRTVRVVWLLVIVGTISPNGWENALAGFQTPFFYLIFQSYVVFYLLSYEVTLTKSRCVVVAIVCLCSIFTLAVGALTCLAAFSGLASRLIFRSQDRTTRATCLLILILLIAIVGIVITPSIEAHAPLRADSLITWWVAFTTTIGWPTSYGLLVWIPFGVWTLYVAATRVMRPGDVMLVALATFAFLNAAAIAWSRGTIAIGVVSRYWDIAWLAWLVNLWAAALLMQRMDEVRYFKVLFRVAFVTCFAIGVVAMAIEASTSYNGAVERGAIYATQTSNTWNYVVRNDPAALANKPLLAIPYPDEGFLRSQLDDPTIRGILPPGIRPGILQRSQPSGDALTRGGLVLTGVPYGSPPAPAPTNGYFYGTFGKEGNATTAHFIGPPIRAQGRYVRLLVSGFAGQPGLSLYLENASTGARVSLAPAHSAGNAWVPIQVRVPGPEYRLIVEDSVRSEQGWFAFTDPVEIGALRPWANYMQMQGKTLTLFAVATLFAALALFPLHAGSFGYRVRP